MTISSATRTKKEYAEKPFTLWDLQRNNSQFTITEDLKVSQEPRVLKIESKKTPGYKYEVVAIKATDRLFEKDLHLYETEWTKLCAALPEGLLNLKGVTFAFDRGVLTYITAEHMQPREKPKDDTPASLGDQRDTYARMLCEAIKTQYSFGVSVTVDMAKKISETIGPGDGLGLYEYTKRSGWITEDAHGIVRGQV